MPLKLGASLQHVADYPQLILQTAAGRCLGACRHRLPYMHAARLADHAAVYYIAGTNR